MVNHISCAVTTVNNTNMKNGRKISPISSDLPPCLRHPQVAVIRQKMGGNEPSRTEASLNSNDLKPSKAGSLTTTMLITSSATENTTMGDCKKMLGGGRLESFQNKLADLWSNGLMSSSKRVNNMKQSSHKFSLEQQPNRDIAQAVLDNRGTRSLPSTCRPQFHFSNLPVSITDCLKLAASPAALECALEIMEGEEEEEVKSSSYYFEAPLYLLHSATQTPAAHSRRSKVSRTTLTTISPIGLAEGSEREDNGSESPARLPSFFEILDIAASHPDMVHFQQVLNDWIKKQSKVMGSAFLMVSSEHNTTYCQVCGNVLLEEPINFGGSDLLANLFSLSQQPDQGEQVSAVAPVLDLAKLLANQQNSLPPKLCSNLEFLLQELSASQPTTGLGSSLASLIGIRARCGFVAALVLAHSSNQNRWEELNIVLPHMPVLSTLMSMVANVEEQKRLAHQSQVFLSMTQNVFSSLQDMNLLVRNITKEAKALVQAEICSLFLLDKEHSELVAEVFEKNGTSDEYLTEIRMPLTQGIVGHVATTGQMMNVKEVYNHPYFYPKVDERTGFVTRNILCFPIKDSQGNLVGVAELCNKIGKSSFTKHDEQIATTFAVYCAISISHCLLYRKLQEAHRRSHMAAELLVQGSTLSIAPEDILRLTVREIPPPTSFHAEFNGFHFVPRSIGTGDTYVEASLSMFKELGFIDKYRLRRRTLARFLLMVQKGYRDVPYHNWSHAFAVGHFCYLLIRMPAVMDALNDLERFSLLVACLCHDIDHRGTTNAFQLQSKTPLAQLYSSEGSVLERHHFAQTVTILGMDECNIFEQLTRQQYQTVLDSIREIILATDIAAHLRKVNRIKQMVDDGYDAKSPDHHYLLMCLLMTASDLSDQSKDFKNSKGIAENIYKEFFSQGDLEKQMGNRPIEMMDRERACVPKIQLEFMDTVALPVFDYISQMLPDLSSTYESLVTNRCCWSTLDNILQEEGLPSGGLDYLKDIELEKRVMQRIDKTRPPQFGNIHEPAEPVGNEQKEEKEEKQSTTQKPEGLAKSNSSKPPASSSNKRPKLPKSLAKPKT